MGLGGMAVDPDAVGTHPSVAKRLLWGPGQGPASAPLLEAAPSG